MDESADESLRDSIRARVASGHLPRLAGATWAGQASGDQRCACCHRTIRAHENAYEPRDQVALYAHVRCFIIWLSESRLVGATPRRPLVKIPPDEPHAALEQAAG